MRSLFPSFYKPTQPEFEELWDKCIFVFDTNILLEMYFYTPETTRRIFSILERLKDRVWLPYHVVLEFHLNRLSVINKANTAYREIREKIEAMLTLEEIVPALNSSNSTQKRRISDLVQQLLKELGQFQNERAYDHEQDRILEKIDQLFSNKIGSKSQDADLEKWEKDAEQRFKQKRPPGYEDDKEKDLETFFFQGRLYQSKYGDYLIWKQILENVASNKLEHLILVTNDVKPDWWEYINPKSKNRRLGPRRELIEEMNDAGVTHFWMYPFDRFLQELSQYLNINVDSGVIEEVREISSKYPSANRGNAITQAVLRWLEETYKDRGYELIDVDGPRDMGVDLLGKNSTGETMVVQVHYSTTSQMPQNKILSFSAGMKRYNPTVALFVVVTDKVEDAEKIVNQQKFKEELDRHHISLVVGTLETDDQDSVRFRPY